VRRCLPALLTLAACGSERPPHVEPTADTGDAGEVPWEYTPDDAPAPEWDARALSEVLEEGLSGGFPDAGLLAERFLALMAEGDEQCPGDPLVLDPNLLGLEGCRAESGVSYAGHGSYSEVESTGEDAWNLSADFEITAADGARYLGGGRASRSVRYTDEGALVYQEIEGTWRDEGDGGWLGRGLSAYLTLSREESGWLTLEGGGGGGDLALSLEEVRFGPDCQGGEGALSIYQPGGGWYELALDCSGCGELAFGDVELGEACPDLSAMAGAASW
jgi:hypothetical protein